MGEYEVTNVSSTTVNGWQLVFSLPAGSQLIDSWDGVASENGGQISVTNESWDSTLSPGSSTDFGFQVSYSTGTGRPVGCAVDGAPCSGATLPSPTTTTTTAKPTTTTTTAKPTTTTAAKPTTTTTTAKPTTTTTTPAKPTITTTVATSVPGTGLTAVFQQVSSWAGGYSGNYVIANQGSKATTSWDLQFTLPPGSSLTNSWNGDAASSGNEISVMPVSYNADLAPGAHTIFGFQVAYTGSYSPPSSCTINGVACGAGAPVGTTTTTTTGTGPTTGTTTTTVPAPPPAGPTQFAPYIDMTLQQENLTSIADASGIKTFTLAFVVSDGVCTPSWGGVIPVGSSGDYVKAAIISFRQSGGNVIISFGGEAGTELADSCSSATALEAAYQDVVDTYGAYDLDFDIEGAAVSDSASIAMRSSALALLQHNEALLGHKVQISLTLPVLPTGFPSAEMGVVSSAVAAGVQLSIVNPMTMDYGGTVSDPSQMGTYAIEAAQSVEQQVASVYPADSTAQLWAMVGITPLIGQNDTAGEVFTLADADQVAQFAARTGVGRLSMWSVSRDQQCSQGVIDYDSPTCSGILQSTWAFSHEFETG